MGDNRAEHARIMKSQKVARKDKRRKQSARYREQALAQARQRALLDLLPTD